MTDTEKKCDICGIKFDDIDKLNQHTKESHPPKPKVKPQVSKASRYKATGIAAIIAVGIILFVYFSDDSTSGTVHGVQCDPVEALNFHIHAHLDLIVDSKPVTIPAGIGIKPNECLYWLHTHDTSGVIHIESPKQDTFTLGQFIQVWDNTPGIASKFEDLTHGGNNIRVFVNGIEIKVNYNTIPLSAHDEIALVSGDVPTSVPTSYVFGGL